MTVSCFFCRRNQFFLGGGRPPLERGGRGDAFFNAHPSELILWKIFLTRVEGFEHRSEQARMVMSRFEEAMLAAAAALVVMTLLFEISFILDIFINLAW